MMCVASARAFFALPLLLLSTNFTIANAHTDAVSKSGIVITHTSDEDAGTYISSAPKEFGWTADRRLTWKDFQGNVNPTATDNTAAATYCGIGFEANGIGSKPDVKVFNVFYPAHSWVRKGVETPEILAHEQCHFDICELYTRKLKERIASVNLRDKDVENTLKAIYRQVQGEYRNRQEKYEQETEHGIIGNEQQKWQDMIARELNATVMYAGK